MIQDGELIFWSMKMRQYIAITDHILWDIITNGDQATTDLASSSAPKASFAANARKNNEKALNILLSAIPDRHLLSFHDATNAKTLMDSIKAKIGAKSRISAYERFQNILSMLELYDAKVSLEELTLKFLRSLQSWWNVSKAVTLKQSTVDPATDPKRIYSDLPQQASMPTTHDDEDLLQIDEDAMEEIDIRWQVAMITARIRKFMRKTGRPIDLKPKNGITFDKSKIECFNCQKLGHFARECRFAKYQENRANGRQEKRGYGLLKISNQKPWWPQTTMMY
ncbi:ribonuclease H-like domain-containing protein [Tanacetum coccineum]